ncbi:EAL domain-containing protein [Clostridium sp. D5]|uniref:EAL domain-containing protein n=1 Tax=Clostridium sp. D5 TaxID=556261 RepID=UPI0001FC7993|nr:EAL domain-containing protein [Clostridium sp. D5]EGB94753.1 putative diguanylate cyclase/phosphodiesterase [Clostridium sp. D5]
MIKWSLAGEFWAFIVIVILMLYFHEKRPVINTKDKLYRSCLWMSMHCIGLNVLCVILIRQSDKVPRWLNVLMNSIYFMMIVVVCSMVSAFVFIMMLEHVYEKYCLRRVFTGLIAVNVLYLAAVLWNIKSGIIFYFDSAGIYHRGTWNGLGYAAVAAEICMIYICFLKNRPSVSKSMVRVICTIPPVTILLCVFQVLFPEIILNETAMAVANLILFIAFQNRALRRDYLTMVGNRESFYEHLTLRLAGEQEFQLILLSLRQYDIVNQNYGHQKGDEILYAVATELGRLIPGGEVFRFGNVDFAMLIPLQSQEQAAINFRTVKERCDETWSVGNIHTHVRTAFMYLEYQGGECTPSQMMEYLDYGLRKAKEKPGVSIHFTEELLKEYKEEKRILEIMQRSVEQKRFRVWYQPVYHLGVGVRSAEALLRLNDYEGNPLPPSRFIPIAEESGLIDELSWIVLEEVCSFLEQNETDKIESISVNLSMQQFADIKISGRIQECLNRHHLSPDRIKIEVTERVLLQDMEYMKHVMKEMNHAGIRFYLDDFGTGYSNLASVLEFPFECVKLDKSLLKGFPENPDSEKMVRMLTELFHSFGNSVVVEGVEDASQAEQLHRIGVDRIQGYYYSRPLPQEVFAEEFM